MDNWILRLKAGVDAGYYRTEEAIGEQTPIPWAGITCKDCPFWNRGFCHVHGEVRSARAHTCSYYDLPHRKEAYRLLEERQQRSLHRWGEWWRRNGPTAL